MDRQVDARAAGPGWGARLLRGLLIFAAGFLLGANVLYYLASSGRLGALAPARMAPAPAVTAPPAPGTPVEAAPATPTPGIPRDPTMPAPMARAPTGPVSTSPNGTHAVPVAGVRPEQLVDTFTQARGGGRVHDAIDIMAATGTPVVAAVDGRVVKLFASKAGGITLYQFDTAEEFVYYYAHLQGYAPGIDEGTTLRRGQVLGYVGYTGNANPSGPHLHFAIARLDPDKRWHAGTPVNPYPILSGKPAARAEARAPAATPPGAASP